MFQITKRVTSLTYNPEEIASVNELLATLQTNMNTSFTSIKELFMYLLKAQLSLAPAVDPEKTEVKTHENNGENTDFTTEETENITENQQISNENTLPAELSAKFKEAFTIIGYESEEGEDSEISEIQILSDLLEMVQSPADVPEPEIITQTVERELLPGEILVQLNPSQLDLLRKISKWRALQKLDNPGLSPEDVLKKLGFNKASLLNYHGDFRTGIKESKL